MERRRRSALFGPAFHTPNHPPIFVFWISFGLHHIVSTCSMWVYEGLAKVHCGATPPSVMVLFFVNCYFINTVLTISRTNQTPSIYPPNTHQALSNHLRAWDINWGPQKTSEPIWLTSKCLIGCWILRWSDCGWCLTDPGYCQDCIDGITVWKKEIISLYSTTALPSRGWAVGNPFQCPSHGRR